MNDQVLPHDKRALFKAELSKAVNKEYLHNEVLSDQQVLDYESYLTIMGLVSGYAKELAALQNQATFARRQTLLTQLGGQDSNKGATPDSQEYGRLVKELCDYDAKVQSELLSQVQLTLEIKEEQVLLNSHDTYEQRHQLFEHMQASVKTRLARLSSKHKVQALPKNVEDELHAWFVAEINKMNKSMNSGNEGGTETVEDETIRIEDMACNKFGVTSIYQFKEIVHRKNEQLKGGATSEAKPAET